MNCTSCVSCSVKILCSRIEEINLIWVKFGGGALLSAVMHNRSIWSNRRNCIERQTHIQFVFHAFSIDNFGRSVLRQLSVAIHDEFIFEPAEIAYQRSTITNVASSESCNLCWCLDSLESVDCGYASHLNNLLRRDGVDNSRVILSLVHSDFLSNSRNISKDLGVRTQRYIDGLQVLLDFLRYFIAINVENTVVCIISKVEVDDKV